MDYITIIMIIGAFLFALRGLQVLVGSAKFTQTSGVMVSSKIDWLGSGHGYKLNLLYTYEVEGKSYESIILYAGMPTHFDSRSRAEDFLKKYPAGKKVDVFYDPEDPSYACLETTKGYSRKLLIWGLFMFVFTVGIFYLAYLFMSGQISPAVKSDW
jgi:hypothetical protein